eukprot:764161-Hanusia_phi.AAC.1
MRGMIPALRGIGKLRIGLTGRSGAGGLERGEGGQAKREREGGERGGREIIHFVLYGRDVAGRA